LPQPPKKRIFAPCFSFPALRRFSPPLMSPCPANANRATPHSLLWRAFCFTDGKGCTAFGEEVWVLARVSSAGGSWFLVFAHLPPQSAQSSRVKLKTGNDASFFFGPSLGCCLRGFWSPFHTSPIFTPFLAIYFLHLHPPPFDSCPLPSLHGPISVTVPREPMISGFFPSLTISCSPHLVEMYPMIPHNFQPGVAFVLLPTVKDKPTIPHSVDIFWPMPLAFFIPLLVLLTVQKIPTITEVSPPNEWSHLTITPPIFRKLSKTTNTPQPPPFC